MRPVNQYGGRKGSAGSELARSRFNLGSSNDRYIGNLKALGEAQALRAKRGRSARTTFTLSIWAFPSSSSLIELGFSLKVGEPWSSGCSYLGSTSNY